MDINVWKFCTCHTKLVEQKFVFVNEVTLKEVKQILFASTPVGFSGIYTYSSTHFLMTVTPYVCGQISVNCTPYVKKTCSSLKLAT